MEPTPARSVRGHALEPEDPMVDEWALAVLSPHIATALIAHEVPRSSPGTEREYDYLLTYDRDLVAEVAEVADMMFRRFD